VVAVHAEEGRQPAAVLGWEHPGTPGSRWVGLDEEGPAIVDGTLDDCRAVGYVDPDLVDVGCHVTVIVRPRRCPARPAGGIDDQIGGKVLPLGRLVFDRYPFHGRRAVDEVIDVLAAVPYADSVETGDPPMNDPLEQRPCGEVRRNARRSWR
jgi:hypothetical protein